MQVLPCIHACLGDYTTDNRGDVGSWAREASMGALEAVVQLLCQRAHLELGNQAENMAAVLQGGWCVVAKGALPFCWRWLEELCDVLQGGWCVVAAGTVKQPREMVAVL